MSLTLVSLFDGIGGFPLAFASASVRTVATVEIDAAAAAVTRRHFPHAAHFSDVTEVTADELTAAGALIVLTREDGPGERRRGRLTAAELAPYVRDDAVCYICGSNSFAEAASGLLVEQGVPASSIRLERFGPSG